MTHISSESLAEAIRLACRIQQIPAPTFEEGQRAHFVAEQMQASGLQQVQLDGAGNVLGCWPGRGEQAPLVFSAHMDTVFPAGVLLTLKEDAGRIGGPGIGDNSLGVAGLLSLPALLRENERILPGDLWLAATTGEEGLGNLKGIQALCQRFGTEASAYISLEGMGLGSILHRGLGVERLRVTTRTAGGHSWADYGRPSAIHALVRMASKVAALKPPVQPRTSFNIGVIQGGTSINTIAAQASFDLDMRSESPQELTALSRRVRRVLQGEQAAGVALEVEQIGWRPAGEIPAEHPLVRVVQRALGALGVVSRLDIASTEANIPLSLGYPAVTIGLTTGGRAHSREEYIDTAPFEKGLLQLIEIATHGWE